MFVGVSSSVQRLDVGGVEADRGSSILDDLIPNTQSIVARSSVGVEDGVGLAKNGFRVQVNSSVVVFAAICFVAGILEL